MGCEVTVHRDDPVDLGGRGDQLLHIEDLASPGRVVDGDADRARRDGRLPPFGLGRAPGLLAETHDSVGTRPPVPSEASPRAGGEA